MIGFVCTDNRLVEIVELGDDIQLSAEYGHPRISPGFRSVDDLMRQRFDDNYFEDQISLPWQAPCLLLRSLSTIMIPVHRR